MGALMSTGPQPAAGGRASEVGGQLGRALAQSLKPLVEAQAGPRSHPDLWLHRQQSQG